jgi:hypothetical protein
MKSLIVFDLDGTLAESKAAIDAEMAGLLDRLLAIVKVAVISGGAWPQFQQQVLAHLGAGAGNGAAARGSNGNRDGNGDGAGKGASAALDNLSLLPTCGTRFYQHVGAWKLLYAEDFTAAEKSKITASLKQASADLGRLDRGSRQPDHLFGAWAAGAAGRQEEMGSRLRQARPNKGHPRHADP